MAPAPPERTPSARAGQRPSVLVIGVGNSLRHDDATGLEIARRLRARTEGTGIAVHEHEGETLALLDIWEGADAVVLVDAIRSGATPGTIHRFDATSTAIPVRLRGSSSTHAVGVGEAIELARALHRLPRRVVLFGAEGHSFAAGSGLSAEVEAITGQLLDAVLSEARELAR
ncbi:MAG: hydrogenase maturation protease [Solirubrobacterales bacterium]